MRIMPAGKQRRYPLSRGICLPAVKAALITRFSSNVQVIKIVQVTPFQKRNPYPSTHYSIIEAT